MTDLLKDPSLAVSPISRVTRIGHITPSSNISLEPLTYAINRELDGKVAHHFSRISVTHVALSGSSEEQFQMERMLAAAKLLAEAPLDVIAWNGTSASWRGLENDLRLCQAITEETGLPATSSTIGFYKAFREHGWTKIGLAVPYTEDITRQLEAEYARQGFSVTGSAYLGLSENVDFGAAKDESIRELLREAARSRPDCIAVVCTNFAATPLVAEMEEELNIPIVDSIAVTFWDACRVAGLRVSIPGWGMLLGGELRTSSHES
jgi:maleate isomerase